MLMAIRRARAIVSLGSKNARNSGVSNCWFAMALISASSASTVVSTAVIFRLLRGCVCPGGRAADHTMHLFDSHDHHIVFRLRLQLGTTLSLLRGACLEPARSTQQRRRRPRGTQRGR